MCLFTRTCADPLHLGVEDRGAASSPLAPEHPVTTTSPLRRLAAGTALACLGAVALASGAAPAAAAEQRSRYVVQFAAGADAGAEARGVERGGGRVSRVLSSVFPGAVADLTAGQAAALRRNGKVRAVEADQVFRAVGTTQASPAWGLDRSDQRALPLSASFSYGVTGKGVTAYVVDTGLLGGHSEFTGRTAPGFDVVGDGRGTEDCNGHGTHVAGTTGGTAYGMAKAVTVVPVRVLGCDGSGSTSGIVTALDWIVSHHAAGVPAVANLSLGGGASSTLDAAVDRVVTDGVTVVVAAGNSGADACNSSPARAPRALTVGATGTTDAKPSWSNYGTCLDLFAPGVGVTSAWHTGATATNTISGTSMAAPHVAGAVAALLESAPASSPDTVTSALLGAATTGVVTSAGSGSPNRLLHADPALVPAGATAPAATAPSAPTSVTATALSAGAAVSWVRGSDGGSPLTSQTLKVYAYGKGGKASLVATLPVSASATGVTVSGLRSGTSYAFTVAATNAVGTSPASALSNKVKAL